MHGKAACRMHGGKGGAPHGKRNGNYRNGRYTMEGIAQRRQLRHQARAERQKLMALIREIGEF